jgi:hypothetical protein
VDRERNDSGRCVLCDDLFGRGSGVRPVELMRTWWWQALGTALAAAVIVTAVAGVLVSGP